MKISSSFPNSYAQTVAVRKRPPGRQCQGKAQIGAGKVVMAFPTSEAGEDVEPQIISAFSAKGMFSLPTLALASILLESTKWKQSYRQA